MYKEEKGLVYIFTGDGKGKTSAALGVTTRMLCLEKRVVWISWFKGEDWAISEKRLIRYFPDLLEMYWAGKGFYIKGDKQKNNLRGVADFSEPEEHQRAAEEALSLANKILEEQGVDLLVLDELVQALKEGLVFEKDVLELIKKRGKTDLVLTGHDVSETLINKADLVTEMKKIKHPFDKGVFAKRGLDY